MTMPFLYLNRRTRKKCMGGMVSPGILGFQASDADAIGILRVPRRWDDWDGNAPVEGARRDLHVADLRARGGRGGAGRRAGRAENAGPSAPRRCHRPWQSVAGT